MGGDAVGGGGAGGAAYSDGETAAKHLEAALAAMVRWRVYASRADLSAERSNGCTIQLTLYTKKGGEVHAARGL